MSANGALDASSPDARVQAWYAARVRSRWPRVHVDLVEVVPCRGGWRVRAVVRLAELAPADVHVELVPADAASASEMAPWSLWTSQSYDNGCYVFEAPLPPEDERRPGRWLLRVRPAERLPVPPITLPVHVSVPAGDSRAGARGDAVPARAPHTRAPPHATP